MDKNDKEILVFTANDALRCAWEDVFIKTEKGRRSVLAGAHAVIDKWGDLGDFLFPESATNMEAHYKLTSLYYGVIVLKVCLTAWSIAGVGRKPHEGEGRESSRYGLRVSGERSTLVHCGHSHSGHLR